MKKLKTDQQLKEAERKKCVALAKEISKTRDKYTCQFCGRKKPDVAIHSHHIYNEGCHQSMSADTDNLITVCFTHHSSSWNAKDPSFHKNPMEMADWFTNKFPALHQKLRERSRKTEKCDLFYWKKKRILLKDELDQLSNNK